MRSRGRPASCRRPAAAPPTTSGRRPPRWSPRRRGPGPGAPGTGTARAPARRRPPACPNHPWLGGLSYPRTGSSPLTGSFRRFRGESPVLRYTARAVHRCASGASVVRRVVGRLQEPCPVCLTALGSTFLGVAAVSHRRTTRSLAALHARAGRGRVGVFRGRCQADAVGHADRDVRPVLPCADHARSPDAAARGEGRDRRLGQGIRSAYDGRRQLRGATGETAPRSDARDGIAASCATPSRRDIDEDLQGRRLDQGYRMAGSPVIDRHGSATAVGPDRSSTSDSDRGRGSGQRHPRPAQGRFKGGRRLWTCTWPDGRSWRVERLDHAT